MIHGRYNLYGPNWQPFTPLRRLHLYNIIPDEGEDTFLKMITRDDHAVVAGGGNYYFGLTSGAVIAETDTLTEITLNEPSAANGYARKAITRDATGWPTIDSIDGVRRAVTALMTWTPSGGSYDKAITRVFMTDASAGTVGKLLSVSAELTASLTLLNGVAYPVNYELYLQ